MLRLQLIILVKWASGNCMMTELNGTDGINAFEDAQIPDLEDQIQR